MLFNADGERLDSVGQFVSPASDPQAGGEAVCSRFARSQASYVNHSDKFIVRDKNYQRQYAHIYTSRLWARRAKLEKAARNKWGDDIPLRKLFELQVDEKCIVVGTIFKKMKLKPNILKEISEEHNLMPQPVMSRFIDESDELVLEDELQRIVLKGNIDIQSTVSGVTVAICGRETDEDRGKFYIDEFCFQELPSQVERPLVEEDKYVVLVSGLDLGSRSDNSFEVQLLVDLLTGQFGDECQQNEAAKVVRLIIAGNSLSQDTQDKDQLSKAKYLTKKTAAGSVEAMKALDEVLTQLAASLEVDIMSGEHDPANHTMPQQPLHHCMFPHTTRYPTIHCVTNPYDCSIEGLRFLGSSGQPVQDMHRYSNMDDHLDILEKTLVEGHMAPTAPDTLGCYPFSDQDPFLLDDCPHVYFAGNMPEFRHKYHEGAGGQRVLLVTVPRFSKSSTCVLVNLKTLECHPMSFQSSFQDAAAMEEESPVAEK